MLVGYAQRIYHTLVWCKGDMQRYDDRGIEQKVHHTIYQRNRKTDKNISKKVVKIFAQSKFTPYLCIAFEKHGNVLIKRRDGRVVDCGGLENR